MKFTITPPKPRNPWAVAALHRHAGSHRRSNAALRQRGQQEVKRELRQQHPPSP